MGTTIRVNIANGYRPQVQAIVDAQPGLMPGEAVQRWVEDGYGAWIAANITEAFSLPRVSVSDFDVSFANEQHARAFQAAIGGQEVHSAP